MMSDKDKKSLEHEMESWVLSQRRGANEKRVNCTPEPWKSPGTQQLSELGARGDEDFLNVMDFCRLSFA